MFQRRANFFHRIEAVFGITKMDTIFAIFPDQQAAMASLAAEPD